MRFVISLIVLLSFGCKPRSNTAEAAPSQDTPYGVERFENQEVICYYGWRTGMACKWKDSADASQGKGNK